MRVCAGWPGRERRAGVIGFANTTARDREALDFLPGTFMLTLWGLLDLEIGFGQAKGNLRIALVEPHADRR